MRSKQKHAAITALCACTIALATFTAYALSTGDKQTTATAKKGSAPMKFDVTKTEEEWKKELTPEQYRILREKGTERAFTGEHYQTKEKGLYRCAGCNTELFVSDAKFDSGCGWPSFFEPKPNALVEQQDFGHGMVRTEVICGKCGGHLGHVFNDGPKPTGLRYCINSGAIKFEAVRQ